MSQTIVLGAHYRIQRINESADPSYRHKLMAMGMIPGASFQVLRVAPMGDPIQLSIHGYSLCLRAKDLQCLAFEAITP